MTNRLSHYHKYKYFRMDISFHDHSPTLPHTWGCNLYSHHNHGNHNHHHLSSSSSPCHTCEDVISMVTGLAKFVPCDQVPAAYSFIDYRSHNWLLFNCLFLLRWKIIWWWNRMKKIELNYKTCEDCDPCCLNKELSPGSQSEKEASLTVCSCHCLTVCTCVCHANNQLSHSLCLCLSL